MGMHIVCMIALCFYILACIYIVCMDTIIEVYRTTYYVVLYTSIGMYIVYHYGHSIVLYISIGMSICMVTI